MYTILLVEDEPMHLSGMRSMLMALRPQCRLLEAASGEAAVEAIARETVQVVITDIHMPGMNGLDFIQHLREHGHQAEVLILSGYGRFEYAQLAIKLGAFDYVLKPVSSEEMDELLRRIEDKAAQDKREQQTQLQLQQRLSVAYPFYLNTLLSRWMQGALFNKELDTLLSALPHAEKHDVLACVLRTYPQQELFSREALWDTLRPDVQRALGVLGEAFCFYDNSISGPMTALVYVGKGAAEETVPAQLRDALDEVTARYSHLASIDVTVSSLTPAAPEGPLRAYREACERAAYAFYRDMPGSAGGRVDLALCQSVSRVHAARLAEAMQPSFGSRGEAALDAILAELAANGLPPPQAWKEAAAELAETAASLCGNPAPRRSVRDALAAAATYGQAFRALCDWLYQATAPQETDMPVSAPVKRALQHIHAHYADDISLEDIARLSFFSPNYFSQLFKAEVGVRFGDYLQQVRLHESMRLLENSELRIDEVARDVGYHNAKYFCTLFARQFGMTPKEYRRYAGHGG